MEKYIKSISKNLPSNIVLLKAGDDRKCPVDSNNWPMKAWTSVKESDQYDPTWSNYAMLTGSASGIWVFDVDNHDDTNLGRTNEWFNKNNFDPTVDAFTVSTPSGGYHIYFKYTDDLVNTNSKYLDNDIQINGKCVIFIGSSYSKGYIIKDGHKVPYEYDDSYELINDVPISEAPKFILDVVKRQKKEKVIEDRNNEIKSDSSSDEENIIEESKINRIISYLNLLPSNYYDVYNDWIKVLMVIYNELNYEDCIEIADNFSLKSDKYTSEEEVKYHIDSFKNKDKLDKSLRLGSLIQWVKDYRCSIDKNQNSINDDIMTIYDIELYLNDKEYSNYEEAKLDVIKQFSNSICIFNAGIKRYISVYTTYSEENDTKIMDVGKYTSFTENYKHIKVTYETQVMDKNRKLNTVTIREKLTTFIESCPSFLYEKYYIKPYHPFENNIITNKRFKNLFSPMIATYLKNYDISKINPILFHIKEVLADGNDYYYKWIMSWLHQIIRTPWKKTDKCVVLNGGQGSGKSLIFDYMKKHIFGDTTAYYAAGMGALIDRFNWWMLSNIFIICDEPTKLSELNISTYEEKLKTVITAPSRELEKKGGDKLQACNYSNLIITSNHTKGIVIRDEDRRYAIFKVSNKYIKNEPYFDRLTECLDDKDTMNIFFSYLYDYDDIVSISKIPETSLRDSCKAENRSQLEQFLFDDEFSVRFRKDEILTSDILYSKYINWYSSMGSNDKFKKNKIGFCKEMNKLYGDSKQKKVRGVNIKVFEFNDETNERLKYIEEEENIYELDY